MLDLDGPVVRFEILGPLRAWRGETAIDLGPLQQRVCFAVLLLHANRLLRREQLIDAVWGDAIPIHAVNLLHRHVSRLRKVLEPNRQAGGPSSRLVWADNGYMLDVPGGGLDLDVYDSAVAQARDARAAGDLAGATEQLRSASSLWRGPLCDGLNSPFLNAERDRLAEHHLDVLEDQLELEVAMGNYAEVIDQLRRLTTAHPLRERLWGALMLALYQSGRQADALRAYRDVRQHIRTDLGVEPTSSLQRLHQRLLVGDPDLAASPSAAQRTVPTKRVADLTKPLASRPTPAQLPHALSDFAGREAEIRHLDALLDDDVGLEKGLVIAAITGTAGIGKTSLVAHWAHRIRDRFPDGQLYIDLRGFDPAEPLIQPAEAIRHFLHALGVSPAVLPTDLDRQAALYRGLLDGRRMLIILENATDAAQVRPLLPGGPGCLAVVTSRNSMVSLVAVNGAQAVNLNLLTVEEARQILIRRLGAERVLSELAAVEAIIQACAGLPLALSIVAARATTNLRLSLAKLATEIEGPHGSLDAFDCGDDAADVRAALASSYRGQRAPAARLFRLLALHAGPVISVQSAASLTGLPPALVGNLLAELVQANLVIEHIPGSFVVPALLQLYARELSESDGDPEGSVARESSPSHASSSVALASQSATKGQSVGLSRAALREPNVNAVQSGAVGDLSTQTGPFKDVASKLGGKSLDSFPDLTRRLPTRVDRDALGI
ncbi:AfsR/SARP family transcriptional regulator [Nocardia salmonicida]|uniref:AfsR/SARP family transcriptional regulator n=1 Tax=Nocardia salmonicida TaxID=53431 RepID=UPI0036364970